MFVAGEVMKAFDALPWPCVRCFAEMGAGVLPPGNACVYTTKGHLPAAFARVKELKGRLRLDWAPVKQAVTVGGITAEELGAALLAAAAGKAEDAGLTVLCSDGARLVLTPAVPCDPTPGELQ